MHTMKLADVPSRLLLCIMSIVSAVHAASKLADVGATQQGTCSPFSESRCVKLYADGLDKVQPGLGDSIRAHPGTVKKSVPRTIVFGVGSGTTATKSLAKTLGGLISHFGMNFKVSHWLHSPQENCEWISSLLRILNYRWGDRHKCLKELRTFDYTAVADSVGAVMDFPTYELFINFYLSFPNARWILTTRPSKDWALARTTHHVNTSWPIQEPCGYHITKNSRQDTLARAFDLTNDFIRCVVPPHRLLEIDPFTQPTDDVAKRTRSFLGLPHDEVADSQKFPHTAKLPGNYCKHGTHST